MGTVDQLSLVDKYLKQNHTKGQHPYITIAYPAAAKMGMDDVIAKSGDSIATQNPVWQNEDGNVTKRSILGYAGYTEPTKKASANEQLFNALKAKKLYDGDYNNFTEQFSTEDTQNQLFKALKAKKQYDGNAGEFLDTFFPIANEVDSTEVKQESIEVEKPVEIKTEEINWQSPDLKGEWSYNAMGNNAWSRKYTNQNEEKINEIIPTDNVPKEVLQQWEKESKVKAEIEGGQAGQGVWEFVAGKKDPTITTTPVMENVANFKANVQETEEIKNNIISEVELWKEDQIKIKELNDQIKSTPSVVIPNVGKLPLGPDGKLPEFYNQQAREEAQKQTEFRQRLLEGRNETEASVKNSRIGNYLQQAAKLWPENEPISERNDEWLYKTAVQLMQTDDEQGLRENKIAK
jgi:hypothetical protein